MVGLESVNRALERAGEPLGRVGDDSDLSAAYKLLRVLIGALAVTVCPIVIGADHLFGSPDGFRGSVSAYYHGVGGGWFVGALFAMAVFFLSYEYRPRRGRTVDNLLSSFAAVCAVVVALVPTAEDHDTATSGELVASTVHGLAATALFVTLAVFSLYQFTKTGGEVEPDTPIRDRALRFIRTEATVRAACSERKKTRNLIYRSCGWLIVAALVLAGVTFFVTLEHLFLIAEIIAVGAFGMSWLVKGGAFAWLNDEATEPAPAGQAIAPSPA